jgi:hypothetical protein
MKYYVTLLPLLIFFTQRSFGQFKNTYAPNGNPTTQIIDASGMKQGNWNYYNISDQVFRIETYTDNVLIKHTYLLKDSEIDIIDFQIVQLSQLNSEALDFIIKELQPSGNGELIVSSDGSIQLQFYLNKLKGKIPSDLNLNPIKQLLFKSSIIKF